MTSLPKTMAKFGPPRNQMKYISFERCFLLNLSPCVKSYVKFWLFSRCPLTKYHLTQYAKFRKFSLFCPNSTFNIRKSHKISSGKALYFRSYQQKTQGGGGNPPVPLRLSLILHLAHHIAKFRTSFRRHFYCKAFISAESP